MSEAADKLKDGVDDLVGEIAEVAQKLDELEGRFSLLEEFSLHTHELAIGSSGDQLVTGSGDAAADESNLKAALQALSHIPGTLWLQGNVIFPNEYLEFPDTMTALRGRGGMAQILSNRTGGVCCGWRGHWRPTSRPQDAWPCRTTGAMKSFVHAEPDTSRELPQPGQWIVIWSDDEIQDVQPHHGQNGKQHPMELHQVEAVYPSENKIKLADPVIDEIATNGRFVVVDMLPDRLVEDVCFEQLAPSQSPYTVAIYLGCCLDATLRRVRQSRMGSGSISFQYSANCLMTGCDVAGSFAVESVYGVTLGVTNGVQVANSVLSGTRHPVTTMSGHGTGNRRWGTPIATVVEHCVVNVPSKDDGNSRIGLDTHAEGYLFTVRDCLVRVGGDVNSVGIQTRSRRSQIINNTIIGGARESDGISLVKAIRSYAADALIQGNTIINAWLGIGLHGEYCRRNVVLDNVLLNCRGPGIYAPDCGDGQRIERNSFVDCGQAPGGNPSLSASPIMLITGTKHRVLSNGIDRHRNQTSVDVGDRTTADVAAAGNVMLGYGNTGITGVHQISFEAEFAGKNFID